MRKHVLIATGLAVLSTSAFATKARMEALGQDAERGSHYIKDTRNVFRNAAHVNTFKNYIVTEWGQAGTATNAEGGFFREQGSFTYGLYMGSQVGAGLEENAATGFLAESNRIQAFIGGDMGVQWGASLYHAANKDETTFERKHSALGASLGVVAGALEGYLNLGINNKAEGGGVAGDELKGDLGINLGGSYAINNWTVFAEYDKYGNEEKTGGATTEYKMTTITVGAGHTQEVTSTARVFTDVKVQNVKEEDFGTETKGTVLPVTVGFETDATSWLTLRGSISQNVILNEVKVAGVKRSLPNSTDVAAGATLTFGKLMVDGMIGTTAAGRAAGQAEEGVLATDNLLTKVAVHYWF